MTAFTRNYSVLTCDNCAATLSSHDAGFDGSGTTALRIWASSQGWKFAQVMIPYPPGHRGNRECKRQQFDFCGECGIPDKITTELTGYFATGKPFPVCEERSVPVTLLSGVVVYGQMDGES